jgi:polysaccharide export outer membrane protein
MFVRLISVFLILCLAGCAGTRPLGGGEGIRVVQASDLPPPAGIEPGLPLRPYRVGINDELLVDVIGFEELQNRKFVVDSTGHISVPLAGSVVAVDRTPKEIEEAIIAQMRGNFVRDPIVAVNISVGRSRRITVDGEVKEPGLYPVTGRLTLMQSVAQAKGVAEFAKQEDVVVFRTVGDDRMVALYNLAAIRRGAYPDPEVFADDVVVVGESRARRLFRDIIQSAPLLVSPLVAILDNR